MPETENYLVLVADDEPSTRALVADHLRNRGYQIIEASDGDEAWDLAQEHLPNLIILDVMMPGMSGWEVCRRIREAVSLAHTGVIMLTGIGEHLNAMTSPLYGADAYVDKPFDFRDLDAKVADSLASRSRGILGRPDGADIEPVSGPSPDSVDYLTDLRAPRPASIEADVSAPVAPAGGGKRPRRATLRAAGASPKKRPASKAKKPAASKAKKPAASKVKKPAASKAKKPRRAKAAAKTPKRAAKARKPARAAKKPVARKGAAKAKRKPAARRAQPKKRR
jgi:CheY-like chemotaxis protein